MPSIHLGPDFKSRMACTNLSARLPALLYRVANARENVMAAGEIACGYASGCLSREQTLKIAFHRGRLPVAHGLTGGLMVATGLSASEACDRVQGTRCVLACDNSCESTTLSGASHCIPHADLKCSLPCLVDLHRKLKDKVTK